MRAIELSPEGELGENAVAEISKKDQLMEKGFGSRFESFMDGATEGLWAPCTIRRRTNSCRVRWRSWSPCFPCEGRNRTRGEGA